MTDQVVINSVSEHRNAPIASKPASYRYFGALSTGDVSVSLYDLPGGRGDGPGRHQLRLGA